MFRKVLVIAVFLLLVSGLSYAGERFKWLTKLDDEDCMKTANIGVAKGVKDRQYGVRDCDKWAFVDRICKDCSTGLRAELATCYEFGYDAGYYDRR